MKYNREFEWVKRSWKLSLGILLFILPNASRVVGQIKLPIDTQLQSMKHHYRQWLANRSESELLIEFDPSPIALDVTNPRFTWKMIMAGRAKRQTGYQILVASSKKNIESNIGDMWNPGMLISDQSSQVKYYGLPLLSNKEYYWKVRIRDEAGTIHPFSKIAAFNTGLFSEEEWTASWISKGDVHEIRSDVNAFLFKKYSKEIQKLVPDSRSPLFRHEFRIDKKIQRARLFVAGLGLYELRLNGKKVGKNVLAPARTDFRKRILYDTYDITSDLNSGMNALGIMLGNGWFNGQKKYWGWQMQWYGSPRAILQLEIEYADGSKSRVATDGNWKSSWSPVQFNCLFDGEQYDARLEEKGWDKPGFDDTKWTAPNVVASPGGRLCSALHEPGEITQIIPAISLEQPRPDTFVFDLGQNIAGWVRLKVQGPSGTKVKLKFAERKHANGMIDPSSSRAALQEDQYILRGEGVEYFEPRFTYHGFQYVQVTGFPGTPLLETIEGRFIQNAVAPAGSFECSNDLITRIHLCTVQSQRSNIQMGVPTDDTQRPERQGWGADALMTSQEAMLNVDIPRVYTKWFQDNRDQQDDMGRIGCIVPRAGIEEDLVWSSAFIIMPWYQYIHYGDSAVLEENYNAMVRHVNFFASQGRADIKPKEEGGNPLFDMAILQPHLIGHLQQSQWGDHLSLAKGYKSRSGLPLSISTAFYYHDVQVMEKIAGVLRKKSDQEKFRLLGTEIKNAFNNKFLHKQEAYYDEILSQSAQVWPLYFGMVPAESENDIMNTLLKDIIELNNSHPTTGYIGTKYLLDLLTMKSHQDLVWDMALKTDFPSWSYFLRDGRTTITEAWTGGGSQNHLALGAAIDPWFYTVLAGINPDESAPGFKKFTIKPFVPNRELEWVKASVHTMHGTITSSWQKKQSGLMVEIKVPANTTATVYLPATQGAGITESGKPISGIENIKVVGSDGSKSIFEVGSGSYSFFISKI